jgi:hypothetical protein
VVVVFAWEYVVQGTFLKNINTNEIIVSKAHKNIIKMLFSAKSLSHLDMCACCISTGTSDSTAD